MTAGREGEQLSKIKKDDHRMRFWIISQPVSHLSLRMSLIEISPPTRMKRQVAATGSVSNSVRFVTPGETITTETGILRGHGTFPSQGDLVASVGGVVVNVNMLVSVHALKGSNRVLFDFRVS